MIKLFSAGNSEVGGGGSAPDLTTGVEVDTGRKLDGNTLYEKVINVGSLPNNGTKNVAHGISGLLKVKDLSMTTDNGTDQWHVTYTNGVQYLLVRSDNTNIRVSNNSNWTTSTGIVTMTYTRS